MPEIEEAGVNPPDAQEDALNRIADQLGKDVDAYRQSVRDLDKWLTTSLLAINGGALIAVANIGMICDFFTQRSSPSTLCLCAFVASLQNRVKAPRLQAKKKTECKAGVMMIRPARPSNPVPAFSREGAKAQRRKGFIRRSAGLIGSSRTPTSPTRPRPRPCSWIPAFAGMTEES
jgi:hypothetical protein